MHCSPWTCCCTGHVLLVCHAPLLTHVPLNGQSLTAACNAQAMKTIEKKGLQAMAKEAGLDLYKLPFLDARPERQEWLAQQPKHPPMASRLPFSTRLGGVCEEYDVPAFGKLHGAEIVVIGACREMLGCGHACRPGFWAQHHRETVPHHARLLSWLEP